MPKGSPPLQACCAPLACMVPLLASLTASVGSYAHLRCSLRSPRHGPILPFPGARFSIGIQFFERRPVPGPILFRFCSGTHFSARFPMGSRGHVQDAHFRSHPPQSHPPQPYGCVVIYKKKNIWIN